MDQYLPVSVDKCPFELSELNFLNSFHMMNEGGQLHNHRLSLAIQSLHVIEIR